MNKFGIIAAMQEEMQEIENIMTGKEIQKIYELNFIKGKINNTEVVLVEAGIGKVNAARTTQILINNFDLSRGKRKKIIDGTSAVVILQGYLDRKDF